MLQLCQNFFLALGALFWVWAPAPQNVCARACLHVLCKCSKSVHLSCIIWRKCNSRSFYLNFPRRRQTNNHMKRKGLRRETPNTVVWMPACYPFEAEVVTLFDVYWFSVPVCAGVHILHFSIGLNRTFMEREDFSEQNISEHVWESVWFCFLWPICCHMCPAIQRVPQRVLRQLYAPLIALIKNKQGQKHGRGSSVCVCGGWCVCACVCPCVYVYRNMCIYEMINTCVCATKSKVICLCASATEVLEHLIQT